MADELNLVKDLAVILIAAGVFTVISRALKQPLILGYIVAGFIVGPHLGLFPALTSTETVSQWSEIGIIFLLFALGLEFSFKKLLKVGSSALITAGTICIGMFMVGMVVGRSMGWTSMESIFLGGLMGMSSTTIIIKAYTDMGLKEKPYATLIFGSLVFEDLIAVLMMVLLSTLAVSQKFDGGEMVWNLAKLAFFLILWFVVGIYLIPTLLGKARKYLSDEILLIIAIGLCFGMVALASAAGFSSALGAFVMGSLLSETLEGERIGKLLGSIKDLFGAIFFVSVGMMVDPVVIGQHWGTILVLAVAAVVGLLLFSSTGALLAGKGLDTAVHTGFTMAQLGEFGFIIASLGCSLGVMRDFIYPVIISVSVLTTFSTPYMIKAADPVSKWLQKKLPERIQARLAPNEDAKAGSAAEKSEWRKLIGSYLIRVLVYSVVIIAVLLASDAYLDKLVLKVFPAMGEGLRHLIELGVTLVVLFPLLYGLGVTNGSIAPHASKLLKEKDANKVPIRALMFLRILLAVAFLLIAIVQYFKLGFWAILLIVLAAVAIFYLSKFSVHKFSGLEERFIRNLNQKEEMEKAMTPVSTSVREKLGTYDVRLQSVTLSPDSAHAGACLRELPYRHECGVNIVKITRGSHNIIIPAGDERVYPGDQLLAVGTPDQLNLFKEIMERDVLPLDENGTSGDFDVITNVIGPESFMLGKSLRELDMRGSACMVISVLRDSTFVTNPKPDFRFEVGDTVWIAGERKNCEWFI